VGDGFAAKGYCRARPKRPTRRITSADASTLGLHKPGWRIETGGNTRDQLVCDGAALDRAELYRLYDEAKATEYLTPSGTGEREFVGTREGDTCTIDGFQGRLRRDENGKLRCFPDARGDSTVRDERQAAYQEYQDRIQNMEGLAMNTTALEKRIASMIARSTVTTSFDVMSCRSQQFSELEDRL
jgi:hypothetical protein